MPFYWGSLLGKRAHQSSSHLRPSSATPDVPIQQGGNGGKGPGMSPQGEEAVNAWLRGEGEASLTGLIKKQETSPRNMVRKLAPAPRGGDQVRQWLTSNSPDALENVLRVRDRCSMEAEYLKRPPSNLFVPSQNGFADPYTPLSHIDEDYDWKTGVDCPEDDAHLPVFPLESRYSSLAMLWPYSESSSSRGSDEDEVHSRKSTPFLDLYRSRPVSVASRLSCDVDSDQEQEKSPVSEDGDIAVILPLASATIRRATRFDMPSRLHPDEPADSSSSSTDTQAVNETSNNEEIKSTEESEDGGHILPVVVGQPMRAQEIEVPSEDASQAPQLSDADLPKGDAQAEAEPIEEGEDGGTQVAWSPDSTDSDSEEEKDEKEDLGFLIMLTPASPPESRTDMEDLEFHDPNIISIIPADPEDVGTGEDEGCEYNSSSDEDSSSDSSDGEEEFDEDEEWMGDWNTLQRRLEEMSDGEAQQATPELAPELSPPSSPGTSSSSLLNVPRAPSPPSPDLGSGNENSLHSQHVPVLLGSLEAAPHLDMIRRYLSLPDTTTPQQIQGSLARNPEILRASILGLVCNPAFKSQTGFEVYANTHGFQAACGMIDAVFAINWERSDDPSGRLLGQILHSCNSGMCHRERLRNLYRMSNLIKLDPADRRRQGRATWAQRCRLLPKLNPKQIVRIADESSLVRSGMFEQFVELVEMGFIITDGDMLEKPGLVLEAMDVEPPVGKYWKHKARRRRIRYPERSKLCQTTTASDGDGDTENEFTGETQPVGRVVRTRTTLEIALSVPRLYTE